MSTLDPYVDHALDQILADNPALEAPQLEAAEAVLIADSPEKRYFLREIQRLHPEVTFFWDAHQQEVGLKGMGLKK